MRAPLVIGPLRRLLRRVALAVVAAQAVTAGALIAVDSWRKRMRPREATFPRTETADLPVGESTVTVYTYGTVLYDDMLAAIEGARERVLFESFIVKDDEVGQRFKAALIAAAERGVEVFVIYDVFANLVVKRAFFDFPPSVNVMRYPALKPGMLLLDVRKSGRDHRKLLVVDGEIGFVGGYNVGSAYATQWRDTHMRVRGPSAWELENAFVDFWNQHRAAAQPSLPQHGSTLWEPSLRVHRNVPSQLIYPIRGMYLEAIDRASEHISITQPYFIPDRTMVRALLAAARRGVDVRVLVPAASNHVITDWLSRGFYARIPPGRSDHLEIRARDDPRQDDDRRRAVEHDRHRQHRSPEPDRQLRGQRRDLRSRSGTAPRAGLRHRPLERDAAHRGRVGAARHRREADRAASRPSAPAVVTSARAR